MGPAVFITLAVSVRTYGYFCLPRLARLWFMVLALWFDGGIPTLEGECVVVCTFRFGQSECDRWNPNPLHIRVHIMFGVLQCHVIDIHDWSRWSLRSTRSRAECPWMARAHLLPIADHPSAYRSLWIHPHRWSSPEDIAPSLMRDPTIPRRAWTAPRSFGWLSVHRFKESWHRSSRGT